MQVCEEVINNYRSLRQSQCELARMLKGSWKKFGTFDAFYVVLGGKENPKRKGVIKMAVKRVLDDVEGSLKLAEVIVKAVDAGGSVFFAKTLPDGSFELLKELQINLWHDSLPQDLIDRATKLYPGIRDLFPNCTVDDWVNSFKYDMYPEAVIANWEKLVFKFRAKTKGKRLSAKEKRHIWIEIISQDSKERPFIIIDGQIAFA